MALSDKSSWHWPVFWLVIVAISFIWSAISPFDRFTWFLETLPVMIVIPLLGVTYQRFRLTNLVYALIALHCIILIIGGHYTYAKVPLFDWIRDHGDFVRNHYDRIGHLAQGFVPAILIRELLIRTSPLKPGKWMVLIVLFACLGISATYEIFEWLVAAFTGEAAEAFLGTQGDPWDTQKDMFFAFLGAVVSLCTLSSWHNKNLKQVIGENTDRPKAMAVLFRHLRLGQDYDAFYQAWLPPHLNDKDPRLEAVGYYDIPVQAINAVNVNDPQEIISIGLVWATPEEVYQSMNKYAQTDAARGEQIDKVCERETQVKFYRIQDVNELGK